MARGAGPSTVFIELLGVELQGGKRKRKNNGDGIDGTTKKKENGLSLVDEDETNEEFVF